MQNHFLRNDLARNKTARASSAEAGDRSAAFPASKLQLTCAHFTPIFDVYDQAMPEQRRFRSPWVIEDLAGCFVVKARGGQELAYIYYEDDPRRRSIIKLLSRDEARRIAAAIANLPEVVRSAKHS
jgi:hypothetical protein